MATAAQKRRYWSYRRLMYVRGKQKHILPLEEWVNTPKHQLIPLEGAPGREYQPLEEPKSEEESVTQGPEGPAKAPQAPRKKSGAKKGKAKNLPKSGSVIPVEE